MLRDERTRLLFERMAQRSGIHHRFSCLSLAEAAALYTPGAFPSTQARMRIYQEAAPVLLRRTLDALALSSRERDRIRHVVVTSCTGMYAPGLDFAAVDHLGLASSTERTTIGFMGCYAAINALKQARHIVRSEPGESVLVLNLELSTLHFHETQDLGEVLSFLLFADGCAAALVSAQPPSQPALRLDSFQAIEIPGTRELITWRVGDLGFEMVLSGQVPGEIAQALAATPELQGKGEGRPELWAVHPGGRSVLDAVERGLGLSPHQLAPSRQVLACHGNMSSATVMFVLKRVMEQARAGQSGCAISFGPGLVAETVRFHAV
jgi:alpha-pyrone synthase